jgi:pSer/pThr/pTyr-binding forkhead associated (FHA) protein
MPKLIITREGVSVGEYPLTLARTAIGRRPGNDLLLDEPTVSGEHAAITLEGPAIIDLGSTNGTFVNGERVTRQPLAHGDRIRIGSHELQLVDERANDFAATQVLPRAGAGQARLAVVSGPRAGTITLVTGERLALGRAGAAAAVLLHLGEAYRLLPIGEIKGVRVNGRPLAQAGVTLADGDLIAIAGSELRFEREGRA